MTLLPLVLPIAVLTLCALSDLTSFTIPNRYVAVLLAGWPVTALATGMAPEEMGVAALCGGIALLVGFGLFAANLLGAGDVKLIAATTLWVAPGALAPFILFTAMLGGALSLLLVAFRKGPLPAIAYRADWITDLHGRASAMPYGVAIAGGAMIALARGVAI